MDFFKRLFKRKSAGDEVYVGLFLKEKEGMLTFFRLFGEGYKVLSKKKFVYSNGWENIVEDIDQSIFKLETETKESPKKAIFFIYSHLVDKKTREIKPPYIDHIKSIAKNLEITPLGYIEYHEAIVDYFNKKDSTPLTALIIEFDKNSLSIFVYRAGKLLYEENIPRTDNLIEDLVPSFEKVRAQSVIPSRLILYDSSDIDVASSKLVTHKWKQDFFVQLPKAHVVHEDELMYALHSTFVAQIAGKTIAHDQTSEVEIIENSEKEVLGFTIGSEPVRHHDEDRQLPVKPVPKSSVISVNQLFGKFKNLTTAIKLPKGINKNYILPALGVLVIISSLFFTEFFFHTATITVFFPSKKIEKKIVIDDLKLENDTKSATFKADKTTTGKKETGEKSKGSITIYNSSIQEGKNYSKGTSIKSPDGLEFLLDSDVKVASASGDASSVTSSTAKVSVTAANIGSEYNVGKDTKFSIGGESTGVVIAKNESAFAGGTKKQVQTVSRQDLDVINKEIEEDAKEYVKKNIEPKIGSSLKLVKQLTQINNEDPTYSSELGEETDSIQVESTVKITYFYYKEGDLKKYIAKSLNKEKDLIAEDKNIRYKINDVEKNGDEYKFDLDASVVLTKKINEKELLTDATGKSAKSLEYTLKKKYDAEGLELLVKHPIPFLNN